MGNENNEWRPGDTHLNLGEEAFRVYMIQATKAMNRKLDSHISSDEQQFAKIDDALAIGSRQFATINRNMNRWSGALACLLVILNLVIGGFGIYFAAHGGGQSATERQ